MTREEHEAQSAAPPQEATAAPPESDAKSAGKSGEKSGRKPRPPTVRYLGFRATDDGREYALQVAGGGDEVRLFLMFISHEAFASHQLKFQDAPGLCFTKLQQDLLADPNLLPGVRRVMGHDEFHQYHVEREMPALIRKRRRSNR